MKEQQLDLGGRICQPIIMGMFYWGILCVVGVAGLILYNVVALPISLLH